MNFLGEIIEFLDYRMAEPRMYGAFHLFFFILSIVGGVLLCRYKRPANERFVRKFLLIASLVSVFLEVYKQFNYTFSYDGAVITGDYQWYAFPFQFCSTPMYAGLLAALIKNEKVHKALCAYLATYSTFAGLCVMFYPEQVFIETVGINIQTMVCHGLMITLGIYLLFSGYVSVRHKTILQAIPVFACFIVAACISNEIAYYGGLLERETFNMFYISPHCEGTLPVYSLVQAVVPFPWCLVIYLAIFTLAAYVVLLLAMLGLRAFSYRGKTEKAVKEKEEQLV